MYVIYIHICRYLWIHGCCPCLCAALPHRTLKKTAPCRPVGLRSHSWQLHLTLCLAAGLLWLLSHATVVPCWMRIDGSCFRGTVNEYPVVRQRITPCTCAMVKDGHPPAVASQHRWFDFHPLGMVPLLSMYQPKLMIINHH